MLTMTNLDGDHILPGVRVEEGETHDEALWREVFEEVWVKLAIMDRIGFMQLRHTSHKPDDYPYLYPDFTWPIWAVSFAGFRPDLMVDDGYEVSFRFVPFQEVSDLKLDGHESALLEAALAMRRNTGRSYYRVTPTLIALPWPALYPLGQWNYLAYSTHHSPG